MKFKHSKMKRVVSFALALIITCGMVPSEVWSYIDLSAISSAITALAAKTDSGEDTDYSTDAPGCTFTDDLYMDAETDAIAALPSYDEYVESTGYSNSNTLRYSLSDLTSACGTGSAFSSATAEAYISEYSDSKLMLSDAQDLYDYSQLANSSYTSEADFYLSLDIVLGDNIEYSEEDNTFMPIGYSAEHPFTGTFDGQDFEIRDLEINGTYSNTYWGMFSYVGESADICNFGLYHPVLNAAAIIAGTICAMAVSNSGYVHDVYVIVAEYTSDTFAAGCIYGENLSAAAGLVVYNTSTGTIENSYFAGMLNVTGTTIADPICASNSGTVRNCYYDADVYSLGTDTSVNEWTWDDDTHEALARTNLQLKTLVGVEDTSFHKIRAIDFNNNSTFTTLNNDNQYWGYPRLYGFEGSGTADDPYQISTPAQLVYFPTSCEYFHKTGTNTISAVKSAGYNFVITNCIDMSEVAEGAYKPQLDYYVETNKVTSTASTLLTRSLTNNINDNYAAFYGTISAAVNDDDDCDCEHINGNHSIINLTIDTPGHIDTNATYNYQYAALIAKAGNPQSISSTYYYSTVENINFIGGTISTGTVDCSPYTDSSTGYTTRVAAVVAVSNYTVLTNVHTSATVKLGTGGQRSSTLGGLTAGGNIGKVTDCTNSGDIIGGYVELITLSTGAYAGSANFRLSGLLGGGVGNYASSDFRYGLVSHCANYGNVYGVQVIAPEDDNAEFTSDCTCYCAGINATGSLSVASNATDAYRSQDIANFGNIYDGPIELDENGDPVYEDIELTTGSGTFYETVETDVDGETTDTDVFLHPAESEDEDGNAVTVIEESKPVAAALPDGYEIVGNNNWRYSTYLEGIGYNYVCNSSNYGDLHAVMACNVYAYGVGYMSTGQYYSSSAGGYLSLSDDSKMYNFRDYNEGDIYVWQGAGVTQASGIARNWAAECYSHGNIYIYGGAINTINSEGGYDMGEIVGVSRYRSAGCYFDGTIYFAPSERRNRNSTNMTAAADAYMALQGVGGYYYVSRLYTNGEYINSVNAGEIIVDFDMFSFSTEGNTSGTYVTMEGLGSGAYVYNYGTFDFIPNYEDTYQSSRLRIYIRAVGHNRDAQYNPNHEYNYTSFGVDFTGYTDYNNKNGTSVYVYNMVIYGVGYCSYSNNTEYYSYDLYNYGDFTVDGTVGTVTIRTIGEFLSNVGDSDSNVTNTDPSTVQNFGDVRIGQKVPEETYIRTLTVEGLYNNQNRIVQGVINYGDIYISGTYTSGAIAVDAAAQVNTSSNGTANAGVGERNVTNIVNYGDIYVYNVSYVGTSDSNIRAVGYGCFEDSINYGDIEVHDIYLGKTSNTNYFYVSGGVAGENNINYGNIDVYNVVRTDNRFLIYLAGVTTNCGYAAYNCENYGDITVDNFYSGTVLGTYYEADDDDRSSGTYKSYDADVYVGGIAVNYSAYDCINYGDIYVKNAFDTRVGGISAYRGTISGCYNYGSLTVEESGGEVYVGGISGTNDAANIYDCMNFGTITVTNPTSRYTNASRCIYIGGIVANYNRNSTSAVVCNCSNYAPITYTNDNGSTYAGQLLRIGGVIGYDTYGSVFTSLLNYGDITVTGEEKLSVRVGGIEGDNNSGTRAMENAINYGDITLDDMGSTYSTCAGGISGVGAPNNAINYGTITVPDGMTKLYAGTIAGAVRGSGRNIDLSMQDDYPVYSTNSSGNYPYTGSAYTLSEETATLSKSKVSTGTYVVVSYSKDDVYSDTTTNSVDSGKTMGVYCADFYLRAEYRRDIDEIYSSGDVHYDNQLIYQDYDLLSPYLQAYLTEKFGDTYDVEEYGAYVALSYCYGSGGETRYYDEIYPSGGITAGVYRENSTVYTIKGDTYSTVVTNTALNVNAFDYCDYVSSGTASDSASTVYTLYSELLDDVASGTYDFMYGDGGDYLKLTGKYRSLYTDYYIFAQQCTKSSLTEIEELNVATSYRYYNEETGEYQQFNTYLDRIETHPATYDTYDTASESTVTEVSDTVLYTDINIYIAIDDITSEYYYYYYQLDENGDTDYDEDGNPIKVEVYGDDDILYLTDKTDTDADNLTVYSATKYYVGDEDMTITDEATYNSELCSKTSTYWFDYDDIDDLVGDRSIWSTSEGAWRMEIPYDDDDRDDAMGTVYSQLLAVQTAEDGYHINMIVVHVILDYFDPSAELASVTLRTPDDGTIISTTSNYEEDFDSNGTADNTDLDKSAIESGNNGRIEEVEDMPSAVSDEETVTYYYVTDDENGKLTGQNIQEYDYISSTTSSYNPTLTFYTYNMDSDDSIYYKVYWLAAIPEDEDAYNDYSKMWETVMGGDGIMDSDDMEKYGVVQTYSSDEYAPSTDTDTDKEYFSGSASPAAGDVTYNSDRTSYGTATIKLAGNTTGNDSYSTMYYGGYYMVELYYERTKSSGTSGVKHFATVYLAKEMSEENTLNLRSQNGTGFNGITNGSSEAGYVAPNAYYSTTTTGDNALYNQSLYESIIGESLVSTLMTYLSRILPDGYDSSEDSVGNTLRTTGLVNINECIYDDTSSDYGNVYFYLSAYYKREINDTYAYENGTTTYNNSYTFGRAYSRKAYVSPYENSSVYGTDGYDSTYTLTYLSENEGSYSLTTEEVTLENYIGEIEVYTDESGLFYPVEYDGLVQVMAENGDLRNYYSQRKKNSESDEHTYTSADGQYTGTRSYDPEVAVTAVTLNSVTDTNKNSDGYYTGTIKPDADESAQTFAVTWTATDNRVQCLENVPKLTYTGGYSTSTAAELLDYISVYFTPSGSDEETELDLTDDDVFSKYFTSIQCSATNYNTDTWKFILCADAPVGTYRIVPRTTYANSYKQSEEIDIIDSSGTEYDDIHSSAEDIANGEKTTTYTDSGLSTTTTTTSTDNDATQTVTTTTATGDTTVTTTTSITTTEEQTADDTLTTTVVAETATQSGGGSATTTKTTTVTTTVTSTDTDGSEITTSTSSTTVDIDENTDPTSVTAEKDGETTETSVTTAVSGDTMTITTVSTTTASGVKQIVTTTTTTIDGTTGEQTTSTETKQVVNYTITFDPFYIVNEANEDSYISNFSMSNNVFTPFTEEADGFDGSSDRSAAVDKTTGDITYTNYDEVRTDDGDVNVDEFYIYGYTEKDVTESVYSITTPYKSTLYVFVPDNDGLDEYNGSYGSWVTIDSIIADSSSDDSSGVTVYTYTSGDYSITFSVTVNEDGTYTYTVYASGFSASDPYTDTFKILAEDNINYTIYTVQIEPLVRNQIITFEVAHLYEVEDLEETAKDELTATFTVSGNLYDEIIDAYGYITATIQEVGDDGIDAYQTKILNDDTIPMSSNSYTTQPYTYNLKPYRYNIYVDLPDGYDYQVVLLSSDKKSYTTLADSADYDGKWLTISVADEKQINIRILITQAAAGERWGVEYFWTFQNAETQNGYVKNTGGGYFYNYVYKKEE